MMPRSLADVEKSLGQALVEFPVRYHNRYDDRARTELIEILFRSLSGYNEDYLQLLFPDGPGNGCWNLSKAQGLEAGAEYSEAARGKRCGHTFKSGDAGYHCVTCSIDETCCLCNRCFNASDHTGHKYTFFVSSGHSGCCDCGDEEAFRLPVHCAIHTALERDDDDEDKKKKDVAPVPEMLVACIRMTIARVLDYFCDVISCSPEQLRLTKTEAGIRQDEVVSRLSGDWYHASDPEDSEPEFALVLWNDEKHTINEVTNQVARACRERERFGLQKANESDEFGRSVVKYSKNLAGLLDVSRIIEQIRVTVTVRSARDTFREQMCATIIDWLSDISGCSVGGDGSLLRLMVCEQMLQPWHPGSTAANAGIGSKGIDDQSLDDGHIYQAVQIAQAEILAAEMVDFTDAEMEDTEDMRRAAEDDDDEDMDDADVDQVQLEMHTQNVLDDAQGPPEDTDLDMQTTQVDTEIAEFGLPPQPPPPPPPPENPPPGDDDPLIILPVTDDPQFSRKPVPIPKTPGVNPKSNHTSLPHWQEKPRLFHEQRQLPHENLQQRTRLDWLILYDLRLWKKTRTDVRELYLATVVNVPEFKRVLGLRFSALYTALAQLYLIADREPDHSIIKLSLQLFTTPSITKEVVDRGNFLTSIMAILYTFLTTRQVGEPHDVSPTATLAMDSGSITNRRLYHFFLDLRYILASDHIQTHLRTERQYLLQFMDLIKLTQGICPNVRAVGEHLEYETDAWIGASILMREITRLCRIFCEAFRPNKLDEGDNHLADAITQAALATMVNSMGMERKRFVQAEIKEPVRFKTVPYLEFEIDALNQCGRHTVVDFVVERGSLSFHHALHYTLSWLLECARSKPRDWVRGLLIRAVTLMKEKFALAPSPALNVDDVILAMFDFPIRVCAWLAQMKAGMWVRNGMSLRHQMGQYRAVISRDVAYCRDIFMIQSAMAICDPSRVLATLCDRYAILDWIKGSYVDRPGYDEGQHVDVADEFMHLLIILISERMSLSPGDDETTIQHHIIRRDIAHTLCFKPLPYTDLSARIRDEVVEARDFQQLLEEVATFRPPDGLNDTGTFELKPQYIGLIDPYSTQYSRNQRDEAEHIFKQWKAKSTGKSIQDAIFEPKLEPIPTGLFSGYTRFTRTPLFAQIIHQFLEYCLMFKVCTPSVQLTRIEPFLQTILHLTLLAVLEDPKADDEDSESGEQTFTFHALTKTKPTQLGDLTIIGLFQKISEVPAFESCGPKIRHILKCLWEKDPKLYSSTTNDHTFPFGNIYQSSSTPVSDNEVEQKKKRALERQAKIMAQFQQQQQDFWVSQENIDGDEDELDETEEPSRTSGKVIRKYPSGNCILCQEDTNDSRLYGTFALVTESSIFRETDLKDPDFVKEVLTTPSTLDRSAESIRPFGIAGENREQVEQLDSKGNLIITEKQGLGKGFPAEQHKQGPVSTGCGHIMHYNCFETYYTATKRRHNQQVARNHPESLNLNEFVCPLCKALGNAFLPILWRGQEVVYPGVLSTENSFQSFMNEKVDQLLQRFTSHALAKEDEKFFIPGYGEFFVEYLSNNLMPSLSRSADDYLAPRIRDPQGFAEDYLSTPRVRDLVGFADGQVSPEGRPFQAPPEDPLGAHNTGATLTALIGAPILANLPDATSTPSVASLLEGGEAPPTDTPSPFSEFLAVYARLRDTMRFNSIPSRFDYQPSHVLEGDLVHTDSLFKIFAYSITSVEIAQRGQEAESGTYLINGISEISLTHLRILCDTALAYASLGGLEFPSALKVAHEFRDSHRRQLLQLFFGHPRLSGISNLARDSMDIEPLLSTDTFVFLAESSLCLVPVLQVDIMHFVRLCYAAEIVKVILAYLLTPQGLKANMDHASVDDTTDYEYSSAKDFVMWVISAYRSCASFVADPGLQILLDGIDRNFIPKYRLRGCHEVVPKYILPFLRKTAILLNVRHGLEFPDAGSDLDYISELDRLTTFLQLPTIPEMFETLSAAEDGDPLSAIVCGWMEHWCISKHDAKSAGNPMPQLSLMHPAIFELVGLPQYFDTLLDEATQRTCMTTGKELTDATLCLFCGEIFCAQASCCMVNTRLGGCNRHLAK
ncbi:E3 ubiquitin-protein ligase ubr1 [Arthroderma uncinatum]|uniref:E3 ubiquitin-protein ligase ubr1 n=1 Tax=Arthroderma uncinatum TaxID=74035 RepID=UPI00144AAA3D|nr:E3 ubiquitin-protein ligase ubr1 [Arthroderma uncinatum]KAF3484417.1 E3 ubiquitin-protein ligase ubr1 [Arthroderma uncinatum]